MSTYALTLGSRGVLAEISGNGGSSSLILQRPASTIHCHIGVDRDGLYLSASVISGGHTNSLQLPADDGANAQHLADWVESIANGTLDTAEAAPMRAPTLFDERIAARRERGELPADMVNHPPHYTSHPSRVECIEVAEHLPFCLGNAFKYLFRRGEKDDALRDIEKAIWYVNRHNETYPEKPALPDEAREALGLIVVHEPHPIGAAMLLIAGPAQCGGYDACIDLLQGEAERLRLCASRAA